MNKNGKAVLITLMAMIFIMALSACGSVVSVNLTLDANGGVFEGGGNTYNIKTDGASAVTIPKNPTNDGYTFDGWFWDKDVWEQQFTASSLLDAPIQSDMTVYAKWIEGEDPGYPVTYTISFDTKGGSDIPDIVIESGATITVPTNPIKPGYTFDGWYLDEGLEISAEELLSEEINDNITLYANWIPNNYTLLFNSNQGDDLTTNTLSVTYGEPIGQMPVPIREGHNFIEWNTMANGQGDRVIETDIINIDDNATIYAIWSVKLYNVYLETFGGTNMPSFSVGYGSAIPEPNEEPEIDDYYFAGWYVDSNYSSLFDFNHNMPNDDITLYAKWTYFRHKIRDNIYVEIEGVSIARPSDVIVPEYIRGLPVEIIGSFAFAGFNSDTLISIELPSSVRLIYNSAFEDCINLETVTMSGVTKIFQYAFKNCSSLESVTFSDNLEYIEFEAFRNCVSLTNIIFPNCLTHIALNSFRDCTSLASITLGEGLTYIGGGAFHSTAISSITIPEGVYISGGGNGAFQNCTSLVEVILPNDLTEIPANTFNGCTALNDIAIPDSVEMIHGTAFVNTGIINNSADGVIYIDTWAISLKGSITNIVIVEGTKIIAESAFQDTDITSVTIAKSVTHIGKEAFRECSLLSEVIIDRDSQLEIIGDRAFYQCISIQELILPSQLEVIDSEAFMGCSGLESVLIYSSGIKLYFYIFDECSNWKILAFMTGMPGMFSNFTLSNVSTEFGIYVGIDIIDEFRSSYNWCADHTEPLLLVSFNSMGGEFMISINALFEMIIDIDRPERLGYEFDGWYYDNLYNQDFNVDTPITQNITLYAKWILQGLDYTLINDNNEYSVSKGTAIGNEVIINNSYQGKPVTKIPEDGFRNYSTLELIVLPDTISFIGDNTFEDCSSLTNFTILATTPPTLGSDVFSNVYENMVIYVPFNSLTEYQTQWSDYSYTIQAMPRVMFDTDDGSIDDINAPFNTYILEPEEPTKTGFEFAGWYIDSELTILYDFNTLINEDITLYADWATEGLNYVYYSDTDSYSVGTGTDKTLEYIRIPARYNGKLVIAIESMGFYQCDNLINIYLPYSIRIIDYGAFYYCTALEYINIPSSVQIIGEYAYEGCTSLVSVEFGLTSVLESIGYNAFADCNMLSTIHLPETLESLGYGAFMNCSSLISINLPTGISEIGYQTFYNCTSLENVTFNEGLVEINAYAFYGCESLQGIVMPQSLEKIYENAFTNCSSIGSIEFNSTIYDIAYAALDSTLWYENQADGVIYAGNLAYSFKGIMPEDTSITINDSTVVIANYLFYEQENLTSITMPNTVLFIGEYAFFGCLGLEHIIIPDSVISIGEYSFSECANLASVSLPSSLEHINDGLFDKCTSLESITLPNSIKSIGNYAFSQCDSLDEIIVPNTVENIGQYAFSNITAVVTFEQDSVITEIGSNAFRNYEGSTITIPNTVNSIGGYAFDNYKGAIAFEEDSTITEIGSNAFGNYKGFTITIPNTITSIGGYAFTSYSGAIIFEDNIMLTHIGNDAFRNYQGKNLVLPNSVTHIGASSFLNSGLESIVLPDSLISIGVNALQNTKLTELFIPSNVETIGSNALISNSSMTSITVSEDNEHFISYEGVLFSKDMTLLIQAPGGKTGNLIIPSGVTTLRQRSFSSSSFSAITLSDTLITIENHVFFHSANLGNIIIPSSVESIGNNAFEFCSNLTTISVERASSANITTGGSNMFSGLTSFVIYVPDSASETAYKSASGWSNYADKIFAIEE